MYVQVTEMDFDFHIMKRKKLQQLCKKHKVPANLTNLEMSHNLSSLFKVEEKGEAVRQARPCLKRRCSDENDGLQKKEKKVRFSEENEVFEVGEYKIVEHYELRRVKKDEENMGAKALLDQMVLTSTKPS